MGWTDSPAAVPPHMEISWQSPSGHPTFTFSKESKRMIKDPLPACGTSNTVVQMKMDSVGATHVLSEGLVPTDLGLVHK